MAENGSLGEVFLSFKVDDQATGSIKKITDNAEKAADTARTRIKAKLSEALKEPFKDDGSYKEMFKGIGDAIGSTIGGSFDAVFSKVFGKLGDKIKKTAGFEKIGGTLGSFLGGGIWDTFKGNIGFVVDILKFLPNLLGNIKGAIVGVFGKIAGKAINVFATALGTALGNSQKFKDSLNQITASLYTMVAPIVNAIMPALTNLMSMLQTVAQGIASFIANIFGKTYSQSVAMAKKMTKSRGRAAKGQLAAFDEINQLNSSSGAGGGVNFGELSEEGSAFAEKLQEIFGKIKEWLAPVNEAFTYMWDNAKAAAEDFFTVTLPTLWPSLVGVASTVAETFKTILATAFTWVGDKFARLTTWIHNHTDQIILFLGAFKTFWEKVLHPLILVAFNFILDRFDSAFQFIGGIVESLLQIFTGFMDFITGVFSGNWAQAWSGIQSIFAGVANFLISGIELLINSAIDFVNGLISAVLESGLGELVEKALPNLRKLAHVNLQRVGSGPSVGGMIAGVAGGIAAFAGGGVITQPTLGLMGEYRGAYSNPEIVAPQSLMTETFNAAIAPLVSAIYDLIGSMDNGDVVINMDASMSAVARALTPYLDDESRRKGVRLVVRG